MKCITRSSSLDVQIYLQLMHEKCIKEDMYVDMGIILSSPRLEAIGPVSTAHGKRPPIKSLSEKVQVSCRKERVVSNAWEGGIKGRGARYSETGQILLREC